MVHSRPVRGEATDDEAVTLPRVAPEAGGALVEAFQPHARRAARWLGDRVELATEARAGLVRGLVQRLLALALPVLVREGVPEAERGWADLEARLPELARLLDVTERAWRRRCELFLEHLGADAAALGARPRVETLVVRGTRTAAERSTLLVRLEPGVEVAYKTKDLRVTRWFLELARDLSEGGTAPLRARRLMVLPERTWDELVTEAPCADLAAVERFYRRAGQLLRLLVLCRATDQHGGNVIAAGEFPELIDLETLFQRGGSVLSETPLGTGFLPIWITGEPGLPAVNAGGLTAGGGKMPVRWPAVVRAEDGRLELGELAWRDAPGPTLPRLDGVPQPPWSHRSSLTGGYLEMDRALLRAPWLRGRLAEAAGLPVRVFTRPAGAHARLLHESLLPERLASEAVRASFLAARAGPEELPALRDGSIPYLTAPADGAALSTRVLSADVDLITSALAVVEEPGEVNAASASRARGARVTSALELAVEVGDELLGHTSGGFVGVCWVPASGVRTLGPLPGDLLSGTAGLAVILAMLRHATRARRFDVAARAALQAAVASAGTRPGAFTGAAGVLFAMRRCATLLEEPALARAAEQRGAALVASSGATRDTSAIEGLGGLALVFPDARLARRVHAAADQPARWPGTGGLPGWLRHHAATQAWALGRMADALGEPSLRVPVPPDAPLPLRLATGVPGARAEAERWLAAARSCGVDELEVAVSSPLFRAHAERLVERLIEARAAGAPWLVPDGVADRLHLSAMTGLGALAGALLRHARPGVYRSLRWLE